MEMRSKSEELSVIAEEFSFPAQREGRRGLLRDELEKAAKPAVEGFYIAFQGTALSLEFRGELRVYVGE